MILSLDRDKLHRLLGKTRCPNRVSPKSIRPSDLCTRRRQNEKESRGEHKDQEYRRPDVKGTGKVDFDGKVSGEC